MPTPTPDDIPAAPPSLDPLDAIEEIADMMEEDSSLDVLDEIDEISREDLLDAADTLRRYYSFKVCCG
jgi:hypothetical protein